MRKQWNKIVVLIIAICLACILFSGCIASGTPDALEQQNENTRMTGDEPQSDAQEVSAVTEETEKPTDAPTAAPTEAPTQELTQAPTAAPTAAPTQAPTQAPTVAPTQAPTQAPTAAPTTVPTEAPTAAPTAAPSQGSASGSTAAPTAAPTQETEAVCSYVLNMNTKKFHKPSCSSVKDIKPENRKDYTGTRQSVLDMGYEPCKRCNP